MKSVLLLSSILVFFIPACISADTSWTKVGFTGGDVTDMVSSSSNPDVLLACVANHGLFRSNNRGENWWRVRDGIFYDLSISEDDVAFAAGQNGLFVTQNMGYNWTTCIDSTVWQVVAYRGGIVAANPNPTSGYVQLYKPWQISYDNGVMWKQWEGTERTVSLLFQQNGVVYRSAEANIYSSDPDNWNEWSLLKRYGGMSNSPNLRFGFAVTDSVLYAYSRYVDWHPVGYQAGGVFRSSDGGENWEKYTDAFSVSSLERSGDTLLIGEDGGILSTATLTSEERTVIGTFGCEITAIDGVRYESGEIIVATRGGIFKTLDRGAHWLKSDAGIMHPEIVSVQVIPVGNGGERIIVSTKRNGIFYSNDNGDHWTWADPDVRTVPGLLKASDTDPNYVYAAEGAIHVSYNGGLSWTDIGPDGLPVYYYGWYNRLVDIDIDPINPDRIVVNYYDHSLDHIRGIYCFDGQYVGTDKYGNNIWEWIDLFEDKQSFHAQFSDNGSLVWISQYPLLIAANGDGEIVDSITLPEAAGGHFWLIDGQWCCLYAETEKRFMMSTDHGTTWSSAELTTNDYVRYDDRNIAEPLGDILQSPDKETLYLLYPGNGVLASPDSGRTWDTLNDGLDTDLVYQLAFSPADPSVIYAATADGLYRLGAPPDIVRVEDSGTAPRTFTVSQNYPNPFNAATIIDYSLMTGGRVQIDLHDVTGRKIRTLAAGYRAAGTYRVAIAGDDLASGMYFCRFFIAEVIETRRIVLLK